MREQQKSFRFWKCDANMYLNIWQKPFEKKHQQKRRKTEMNTRSSLQGNKIPQIKSKNLIKKKKFMKGLEGEGKRNPKNKTNVAGVCGPIKK